MDDNNINFVFGDNILGLGHGVSIAAQNNVSSKTLVAFLKNGTFRWGYAFKNGSNLRVFCWVNGGLERTTLSKGNLLIKFVEKKTTKGARGDWAAADFNINWFDANAQNIVEDELRRLQREKEEIDDITADFAGLTVGDYRKIHAYIQRGLPDI